MEKKIAEYCAKKTLGMSAYENTSLSILTYGFELVISSAIGVVLMIIISCFAHNYFAWFFFLLGFAPLRTTAGGYHATTHLHCYLVSTLTFAICLFSSTRISSVSIQYILWAAFSAISVFLFSPVSAKNKPLTSERRRKNRYQSIVIVTLTFAIAIFVYMKSVSSAEITIFYLGVFTASVSLIIAKMISAVKEGGATA